MKPISFPASPAITKPISSANSIPSIPFKSKNPNFLSSQPSTNFFSSSQFANILNPEKCFTKTPLFLTLCSAKPHIHNDETTEGNPRPIPNSVSDSGSNEPNQMNQPIATSKQAPFSAPTPSSRGLVFDLGPSGSWDSIEVGSPVVKRFLSDDEERWYMWYYGRSGKNPGSDSIGLAVSSNGVHWLRGGEAINSAAGAGVVMKCGGDWWSFDTMSIRPSEIMMMSSNKVRGASAVYWLYYTGFSSEEVELPQDISLKFGLFNPERAQMSAKSGGDCGIGRVYKSLPGLAISQDGRNWARIEGDHHSGALFDVGSIGEWDCLFISSPHVVFHNNGDLRMYYHSFDPQNGKFAIGMARSRDGIKWVKLGKIMEGRSSDGCFDEMGVKNAFVVRDKKVGNYLMAYEGVAKDGKRSIGLAVSSDGLKDWSRINEGTILMASEEEDGWDNKGVGSPCLVQMEGDEDRWRLYHTGVGMEGKTGIGLAVSQGSEIKSFSRWTGFSL